MASWLKRQQNGYLYQSNDIPYIILEDGIFLCFNNYYQEYTDKSEFSISFDMKKEDMIKTSDDFWKLKKFPCYIPFEVVQHVNNISIKKIAFETVENYSDPKKISIINHAGLGSKSKLSKISSIIEKTDMCFMMSDSEDELIDMDHNDKCLPVTHIDWYRTCCYICHNICTSKNRHYCWTKSLPDTEFLCYGFKNIDDTDSMSDCFPKIGFENFEITWK